MQGAFISASAASMRLLVFLSRYKARRMGSFCFIAFPAALVIKYSNSPNATTMRPMMTASCG